MSNTLTVEHFIHKGGLWQKHFKPEMSQCRFSVTEHGRVTNWHQCTRKNTEEVEGYGFCKQHANEVKSRLGLRTDATKTKYAASFRYGKPCLVELEILHETNSTIEISGYKTLMGDAFGIYQGRLRKDSQYTNSYIFVDDFNSAIAWLYEQSEKNVQSTFQAHEAAIQIKNKLEAEFLELAPKE